MHLQFIRRVWAVQFYLVKRGRGGEEKGVGGNRRRGISRGRVIYQRDRWVNEFYF